MVRSVVAACCVFVSAIAAVRAQAPRAPLTPGSVVLLAGKDDPATIATLKTALRSGDAEVRATAARVVAISVFPDLTNDVLAALAREQDHATACELLRALLLHVGKAGLPAADAQAKRLGPNAVLVVAEWMARTAPELFLQRLPGFAAIAGGRYSPLDRIVGIAAMQHEEQMIPLLRAWMAVAAPKGWSSVLDELLVTKSALAAATPVLVQGLQSQRVPVREETFWFRMNQRGETRGNSSSFR